MKKKLFAVFLCVLLAFGSTQTGFAAPISEQSQTTPAFTSAPETSSGEGETGVSQPELTTEQEIAVIVATLAAVGGLVYSVIEKARKRKRGPLRKD